MQGPVVISILCLNNLELTKQCLDSILENTAVPHRICAVNQASTDGTGEYLDSLGDRIDVIHSPRNLGFVGGNNTVMERYPGNDIVLLNNDTIVQEGWLKALHDCAYGEPEIGIVGAKLLYPGGRLQEAGGEIFQDGSGRNIGKNDDADRYIYNVRRDVDYCSGACLFIKREVLDRIGCLDEIFSPAYWEDTDICFRARKAGWRVVYEPEARVIHLEGATSGLPSQNSLSKQLQQRNKPRFMERWGEELKTHRKNVFEVRTSSHKDKILVVLPFLPMYDRAAGEKRWFHTLKILKKHFDVVFLARNGAGQLKYINELERMGITVFHTDESRLKHMGCDLKGPIWIDFPLLLKSNDFKAVIVGFYHMAHQYYRDIRTYSPNSVFIIDSYDLCFVRERRKAELTGNAQEIWKSIDTKRRELAMYERADVVLTVTDEDRQRLLEEVPHLAVGVSTDIHPVLEGRRSSRGHDLVFVGNYNHDPNEDAVLFFVNEILPGIKQHLPEVKLYIVGNAPTERIKALAREDIVVTGFVPEVTPYLLESRVFVVPLRYGSGLKGKIGEALAAGIPIVTTSIGAEGMDLVHGRSALIADDPETFAKAVVDVYTDDGLWDRLSTEGTALGKRNYSYETVERNWEEVFDLIRAGRKPTPDRGESTDMTGFKRLPRAPEIEPDVAIVIPVYNNLDDTRACWTSLKKSTRIPHRLIIIDNGSTEDVAYEADQNNIEVIRNETNRGFAHACNQGISHTHGDFVVILNNDTILTPGWLDRLLWHLGNDETVGIVAPSTNFAASVQQIPTSYRSEKELYSFSEEIYARRRHESVEVPKVVGVCMLIRRRMLEEIGLFDTRFGLGNYEDDDLCLRAKLGGYKVIWAKDTFIHHSGSKTFRIIDADYTKLMEENRRKFSAKWSGAIVDSVPSDPQVTARSPEANGQPVIILGGSGQALRDTVVSAQQHARGATLVLTEPFEYRSNGSDVVHLADGDGEALGLRILDYVNNSDQDTVFFVRPGTILTPGWMEPLAAGLISDDVGCVLSSTNLGWDKQHTPANYRKTGKPLLRFARKNALDLRGHIEQIAIGFPAAMAVKREILLKHGLATEFASEGMLLDLQRRLGDSDLRIVCARDSYVHASGVSTNECERENHAVLALMSARESLGRQRVEDALQQLDEVLEIKPDYGEALYERGVLRAIKGSSAEAIQDFERLANITPGDSRAYNNLGCLYFNNGQVDLAEMNFRKAIDANHGNWEAKTNLADLYMHKGLADDAAHLYSSIIQEHGQEPGVYITLGETFATHGDLGTSEELFKMALRLDPDNATALSGLRRLAMSKKNATNSEVSESGRESNQSVGMHDHQG
jgi:GT2 family glycosyltransferase/Flp pilus assembly protein TadD